MRDHARVYALVAYAEVSDGAVARDATRGCARQARARQRGRLKQAVKAPTRSRPNRGFRSHLQHNRPNIDDVKYAESGL